LIGDYRPYWALWQWMVGRMTVVLVKQVVGIGFAVTEERHAGVAIVVMNWEVDPVGVAAAAAAAAAAAVVPLGGMKVEGLKFALVPHSTYVDLGLGGS